MNNETNKTNFATKFKLEQKIFAERIVVTQQIVGGISSVIKELHRFGKEMDESNKHYLNTYFKTLQLKIEEIGNEAEICLFLISEKRIASNKIIEAEINKNGYNKKYFQSLIDVILEPLYKEWEKALQLKQKTSISPAEIKKELKSPDIGKKEDFNEGSHSQSQILLEDELQKQKLIASSINPIPEGFEQITNQATQEQISDYFMILSKEKNRLNKRPYMEKGDIEELIKKNFAIFECQPNGIYFNINLTTQQKGVLRYFLYQFYQKYELNFIGTKMKYVNFLIHNFELFKNDNPASLNSNMSETKKPNVDSVIQLSKYLKL